jgi:hypothetical protein
MRATGQLAGYQATGAIWRRARAFLHRLMLAASDRYRPERHYMRGPGPKSHAKDRSGAADRD